jgi:deoxyribose-phosphate aldolase
MIGDMTEPARIQSARRVLALLDLTELAEHSEPDDIKRLCTLALDPRGQVAAVCTWPRHMELTRTLLRGSPVKIAAVVNFPDGTQPMTEVCAEAERAIADGADEIDMVLPWTSFLAGDVVGPPEMVRAVRTAIGPANVLKVILEAGHYPDQDRVAQASHLAIDGGADFLKTSTGKTTVSATPEAVRTMLGVIRSTGRPVGIKPSGGIRTLDQALAYLALADDAMGPAWASPATFRFGASALHAAILHVLSTLRADRASPHVSGHAGWQRCPVGT